MKQKTRAQLECLTVLENAAFSAASAGIGPEQIEITAEQGYERWNSRNESSSTACDSKAREAGDADSK